MTSMPASRPVVLGHFFAPDSDKIIRELLDIEKILVSNVNLYKKPS